MLSRSPEDANRTLTCFGGVTRHWIFTSTTCAYRRPFAAYPIRELETSRWDDPAYPYAFNKARMEAWLFEKMRDTDAPMTIIRPSLTYGAGCANIGMLRQNGYEVSGRDFMRIGVPFTLIAVLVGYLFCWIVWA